MPVENTIDKTWVHNRDVNASSFVPYRKVLSYLKQRSMVLTCSCGANHSLLYYFVLTFEESCVHLLILPHFKQVECSQKTNVCSFVLFYLVLFFLFFFFVLSRSFFCFGFFVQAFLTLPIPHPVFILTAHISSNSDRFLVNLSLSKMTPQSLLYLFCICEMFK